jgi:uroporphyrin-III C-methyltransferase/precorrin-2 dehydrogenase/sirohydrochlorin ferrochelatase
VSPLYPVFLKLGGRRVLLVGGGAVAAGKLPGLLDAGARVIVVAPRLRDDLRRPGVECRERAFQAGDVDGAWFVVAAAPPEVNRAVARAAEARGLFVNAVDDADHASAYLGGVLRRAGVTVAVSTEGRAPALAGLLREGLEAVLPDDLERWVELAQARRAAWLQARVPMPQRRPLLLRALNELYAARLAEAQP